MRVPGEREQRRGVQGEARNFGPPTVPRQAATVILLRDRSGPPYQATVGPCQTATVDPRQTATVDPRQTATVDAQFEVLMVRRSLSARFMPGVWVFPGGAVETAEQSLHSPHQLAARRELLEETGIALPPDADLVELSRWITPAQIAIRFDTRFFLAELPPGQEVRIDGSECIASRWLTPAEALSRYDSGEILLVLPTIKHLEQLSAFPTVSALLAHARTHEPHPIEPTLVITEDGPKVHLPGDP